MPVPMIAAKDEQGKVNVINSDRIALFIDEDHKPPPNLLKARAFTGNIADRAHMEAVVCLALPAAIG